MPGVPHDRHQRGLLTPPWKLARFSVPRERLPHREGSAPWKLTAAPTGLFTETVFSG